MLEWLLRVREPEAEPDLATGRRSLTYSRRFLWTACVVSIVADGAFGLTMVLMWEDPPALAWGIGIFGLLWLAAMVAAWDAFWTKVSVSSEGIFLERGRGVLIPWDKISRVRYSRLGSWFSFRAPGYPTVRVSIYRNGLQSLARLARQGMAPAAAANASDLLQEMAVDR